MYLMAHQLLGRSIQPTYLFISHVNSLFSHPLPSLPARFVLPPSSSKHCFSQTSSLPSYRSLLCTATSQPPAALIKDKHQQQFQLPLEDHDYENDEEYESLQEEEEDEEDDGYDDNEELREENKEVVSSLEQKQAIKSSKTSSRGIPQLTVKEKKELSSYAQSLGKKLTCHQVGKSGVTSSLETSISDALEANELIKFKVHGNCPVEPDAVASQLQEATRSVVVRHIGRTFILYRPSRRKAATAETKKPPPRPQNQRRSIAKPAGWKNRKA